MKPTLTQVKPEETVMNEETVDSSLEGILMGRKMDAEKAKGTGNFATKVELSLLTLSEFSFFSLSRTLLFSFSLTLSKSSFFSLSRSLLFSFPKSSFFFL